MPFSQRVTVADRTARLEFAALSQIGELESALDGVVGAGGFERSFALLVELGRDSPILQCVHALEVADAFSNRREKLQGRIALHAADERGRIAALFIAMIG